MGPGLSMKLQTMVMTLTTDHLFDVAQAHSTMHEGHPCPDMSGEYFQDGITNGAEWYSVDGESLLQLFACLTVRLPVCQPAYLFVHSLVSLSACLPVCLLIHLSACLFIFLSFCVSCLSICLTACSLACLPGHLSTCLTCLSAS